MPNLTDAAYAHSRTKKTRHYIETGTYLGNGIRAVLPNYEHIHSIELSEKWYAYNVEQFKDCSNVHMHLGDSKQVLPRLLQTIDEPVTIYLDAHYSGTPTAFGDEETPLLFELDILMRQRQGYDDIIIIDDCRLLGKTGTCGEEGNEMYPPMTYDWREITHAKIMDFMKPSYTLLKNEGRAYTDGQYDQYIFVPEILSSQ